MVGVGFRGVVAFALLAVFSVGVCNSAAAESIDSALLPKIQAATFEVVSAKPTDDPLTYEKPLPLDLLPFQERNDKYYSIGTAFSIGNNRYVTAAHVLTACISSWWGAPALRDANGKVYAIDKIEKFSLHRDFVVFSLTDHPDIAALETNSNATLNGTVYAVGNALGTGVVVRDGLYTSNTPEEQDGRWNFMRFSAAASPGNSGGPLLDKDGKVIGVVLRKSANENLNFALPIAEILNAPDHLADIDSRLAYRVDIVDSSQIGTFKAQFALPLTLADFGKALRTRTNEFADTQLAALRAKESEQLFPNGKGSQRLLHTLADMRIFPALLTRNGDGVWNLSANPGNRTQFPGKSYVQLGVAGRNLMLHWRRPDTVSAKEAYSNIDLLMDELLKTGFLQRPVASEKIKVTALGKPVEESTHTDRWQRRWQMRVWPLAYANASLVTFALPVPDGYVVIAEIAPATESHENIIDLKLLTDFTSVAYDGTLVQWKDFLGNTELLPAGFKTLKIDFTAGNRFSYASNRLGFSLTDDVQPITPDNSLTLGLTFFNDNGKIVWDVGVIRLRRTANDADLINIQRHIKPTDDMEDSYRSLWDKVAHQKHPFDAVARNENDVEKITSVVTTPENSDPESLYTLYVAVAGTKTQEEMKSKLDSLAKNFHLEERGS